MNNYYADCAEAQSKRQLVILRRKSIDDNRLDGYIVGLSKKWVLLHLVDGSVLTLNGYCAVRLKDISSFKVGAGFVDEYLQLREQYPVEAPQIDVCGLLSLLRSVSKSFSLFMIEREKVEPGIGFIGVVEKLTKRNLWLEKLDSKARWIGSEKFGLKDVTLVSFGDGYTEALAWMDVHNKERNTLP